MSLTGKTAIVTGSNSGIGLGIAERWRARARTSPSTPSPTATRTTRWPSGSPTRRGAGAVYVQADMSDGADHAARLVDGGGRALGSVDILVNNAGIQHVAAIEDFPVEKWDRIIAINMSSSFHTTAAALPHMRKAGWGRSSTSPRPTG